MAVPQFDLCFDPSGGENLYEPTEPVAKKPRFGDKSSEEVDALIEERVPISTKRTTVTWVREFVDFCASSGIRAGLERASPNEICDALALCSVNARNRDGAPYQKPSLLALRSAMHRHIRISNCLFSTLCS